MLQVKPDECSVVTELGDTIAIHYNVSPHSLSCSLTYMYSMYSDVHKWILEGVKSSL